MTGIQAAILRQLSLQRRHAAWSLRGSRWGDRFLWHRGPGRLVPGAAAANPLTFQSLEGLQPRSTATSQWIEAQCWIEAGPSVP